MSTGHYTDTCQAATPVLKSCDSPIISLGFAQNRNQQQKCLTQLSDGRQPDTKYSLQGISQPTAHRGSQDITWCIFRTNQSWQRVRNAAQSFWAVWLQLLSLGTRNIQAKPPFYWATAQLQLAEHSNPENLPKLQVLCNSTNALRLFSFFLIFWERVWFLCFKPFLTSDSYSFF